MMTRKLIPLFFIILALCASGFKTNRSPVTEKGERVYVHTDRDIYVAGENIFFKLYLVDYSTHRLSEISSIAYLILRSRTSSVIAKIRFRAEGGTAYGTVLLPDTLSSGLYQIVAFTNWMRNAGEGSFFTKEIFVANRFDKDLTVLDSLSGSTGKRNVSPSGTFKKNNSLEVIPDKTEYERREKINIIMKFPENASGTPANISVSVYEEVPGAESRSSVHDFLSAKQDNFVSRGFPASDKRDFLPEIKGEIIEGRVIDQDTSAGVANTCVFLSVRDSVVNLKYDYSDTDGVFRFLLNDYYDGKDLFFSIKDNPGDKKLKIEIDDKFELASNFKPGKYKANPLLKDYILKSQDIVSIQKAYQAVYTFEIKKQLKPGNICPEIYYKPSYSVNPGDFVPLNDFIEISREILPPQIRIRKHDDGYIAEMADEKKHIFMEEEPLIFLDGVLINDINKIIHLGSDKIKRVEMVCTRYNYGEMVFPGILAVFSKNGEIENMQLSPGSLRMKPDAYQAYSGFTAPVYSKESSASRPDFRQLLYWNPDVKISKDNNQVPGFYASDHSGNYIIDVEGISSDGVPVSATAKIRVK
ncbi:MAG: hypothetical protein ABSG89_12265 [Bacteroidales bacterium]|jgi:hypothetical protein